MNLDPTDNRTGNFLSQIEYFTKFQIKIFVETL